MELKMVQPRTPWLDLESQFRRLLGPEFGQRILQITLCGGEWTISADPTIPGGPEATLQKARLQKLYRSAGEAAGIAAGAPDRAQALDWWLNILRVKSPHFLPILSTRTEKGVSVPDNGGGWILNGALAGAEMCIELANGASPVTTTAPTADESLTSQPNAPPAEDTPAAQSSSTTPAVEDWDGWVDANVPVPSPNLHKHVEYPRCVYNWTLRTSQVVNSDAELDALGPEWVRQPFREQEEMTEATSSATPGPAPSPAKQGKRNLTDDENRRILDGKDWVPRADAMKVLAVTSRQISKLRDKGRWLKRPKGRDKGVRINLVERDGLIRTQQLRKLVGLPDENRGGGLREMNYGAAMRPRRSAPE